MTTEPYVIGGLALLAGYVTASMRRLERPISDELVAFRRREQMQRLKKFLSGRTFEQSKLAPSSCQ